jgi:hypothetical protein
MNGTLLGRRSGRRSGRRRRRCSISLQSAEESDPDIL